MEIKLYDRKNKEIVKEIVYEKKIMSFLYDSYLGLILSSIFIKKKWFSRFYGKLQKSKMSKNKIEPFIKQYKIDTSEIELPISGYTSFNDFFTRKLSPGFRPIDLNVNHLISPADARLLIQKISKDTIIPIKGKKIKLKDLLSKESFDYNLYNNGVSAIYRLSPTDYHRFCYIDDADQSNVVSIKGDYHSVNPFALKNNIDIFCSNFREICTLKTKNFGDVIHIDVGALTVGKIIQHFPNGGSVNRGEEKGLFEFGASTIILLFKPNTIIFDYDILRYSKQNIEVIVKMGEKVGTKNIIN